MPLVRPRPLGIFVGCVAIASVTFALFSPIFESAFTVIRPPSSSPLSHAHDDDGALSSAWARVVKGLGLDAENVTKFRNETDSDSGSGDLMLTGPGWMLSECCSLLFFLLGYLAVGGPSESEYREPNFYRREVFVDILFAVLKEVNFVGPFFSGYIVQKFFFSKSWEVKEIFGGEHESNRSIIRQTFSGPWGCLYLFLYLAGICSSMQLSFAIGMLNLHSSMRLNFMRFALLPTETMITCQLIILVAKAKITRLTCSKKAEAREQLKNSLPSAHRSLDGMRERFPAYFSFGDDLQAKTSCGEPEERPDYIRRALCHLCGLPSGLFGIAMVLSTNGVHQSSTHVCVYLVSMLLAMYSVMRGFGAFLMTVCATFDQVHRGVDQLLIFKSTVRHNEVKLPVSFLARTEALRKAAVSRKCEGSDAKDGKAMDVEDAKELLISTSQSGRGGVDVQLEGLRELDLAHSDDLEAWRALRQYMKLDFEDETFFVDIMVGGSLIYSLWFSVVALGAYASTDIVVKVTVCSMAASNLALFGTIFLLAVNACVDLNQIFEHDGIVLLEVLDKMHQDLNMGRLAPSDGKGCPAPHSHMEYLSVLREKISKHDDPQTILGFKITSTMRNGVFLSLATTALSALSNKYLALAEHGETTQC